jgi:CRP-like cAMP-binding protein
MLAILIQKLELLEHLSDEAKARLKKLPAHVANFLPREDMVREAEPRGDVRVVIEGVAARYKALDAGRHAILGFLLPGDVDESDALADGLDHSISAITACKVAQIPRLIFDQMLLDFPDIGRGFRRMARLDESIRRVWLANMGQHAADRQAAHLFCELAIRFAQVGMGGHDWFTNPLTQEHLANVLGISPVHMNRVIQHLREMGLLRLEGHVVRFPSLKKIRQYADFDGRYLGGEPRVAAPERESPGATHLASIVARALEAGS